MSAVRATATHHQNQCIIFIIDSILLILLIDMEQNIESNIYSCTYDMYKHTPVYSMHVGVFVCTYQLHVYRKLPQSNQHH